MNVHHIQCEHGNSHHPHAFSFLAVGSRDTSCRVFSVHPLPGFHYVNLAAHRTKLVACFFEKESLNVRSLLEAEM